MRDYLRIASKIREADWLITEAGLTLILDIASSRMNGEKLTDEEIAIRLNDVGSHGNGYEGGGRVENGVGIIPLYGPIFGKANMMTQLSGATSLEMFKKDFTDMLADHRVKSVLLDIDSPGGTSDMVQTTGDLIFEGRSIKPVVAVANSNAGSAAYWLGSQASEFYATPDGVVGSIGAYTVHEDQSVADANEGIKYTFISAGPYKTEGNPHQPLSQEGYDYRKEVIDELYSNFLSVVARGRNTDVETVEANYGGGRMIPAKKALEAGMVDDIMEYDAVAESMTTKSNGISVPVQINSETITTAVLDQETGVFRIESVGMEHSEPGTGSPPTPRPNEADRGAYGSRRPDLPEGFPNEKDQPGAPKASAIDNGGNMNEEQLKILYALFGVSDEESLIAAITEMHSLSAALEGDVSLAAEELSFKKQYPQLWQQMQDDRGKIRANEASAYVESVGMFTKPEGDKIVKAGIGLSALSRDKVSETYMLLAGTPYLTAFTECINTIAGGGTVHYGEIGSDNTGEEPTVDLTADYQGIRTQFAGKVAEVQTRDGLIYKDALAVAARENPELAKAYQEAKPVIR